jgi:hypothetical protein
LTPVEFPHPLRELARAHKKGRAAFGTNCFSRIGWMSFGERRLIINALLNGRATSGDGPSRLAYRELFQSFGVLSRWVGQQRLKLTGAEVCSRVC